MEKFQEIYALLENDSYLPKEQKYAHGYLKDLIIGNAAEGIKTRSAVRNICGNLAFVSQIEPKLFLEVENDENWILAMQEELNQFERNEIWFLTPRPKDHPVIGTKWVFRNKMDEFGVVTRNKAKLVA